MANDDNKSTAEVVLDRIRAISCGATAEMLSCPALFYEQMSNRRWSDYRDFRENMIAAARMFDESWGEMGRTCGLLYSYIAIPSVVMGVGSNLVAELMR